MSNEPADPVKIERVNKSDNYFEKTRQLAYQHGYKLRQCTRVHYQMRERSEYGQMFLLA